jgi:hypothetical protein
MVWELSYGQVVALGLTARIVTKREEREREAHRKGFNPPCG